MFVEFALLQIMDKTGSLPHDDKKVTKRQRFLKFGYQLDINQARCKIIWDGI
jgi:hypothetical protein